MKKLFFLFLLIYNNFFNPTFSQIRESKLTNQSDIRMTINNLGIIGNAFRGSYTQLGYPSCKYPASSSIEHLFQGGLWVGAFKNGIGPFVSTATFDSPVGYTAGGANFEFTALSTSISERSAIPQSPFFSSLAISHQDFITEFTDTSHIIPGSPYTIPNHNTPLGLAVTLESYNWNYSGSNAFVILNYKIKNIGLDTLDSLHVGQYYNPVVRNVSQSMPTGTAFFNKSGSGYEDSLFMGYAFDATGDTGFTESYIGVKFLGAEKLIPGQLGKVFVPNINVNAPFKVNYQSWLFGSSDPYFFPPPNDPSKFSRMSLGMQSASTWDFAQVPNESLRTKIRKPGNRPNVLSCGNLKSCYPGMTLSVVFAVVFAKKDNSEALPNTEDTWIQRRNLRANATRVQAIYNGEDVNANGVLEPTEDINQNGIIDRYLLSDLTPVPISESSDDYFYIYPNPSNGSFSVSISCQAEPHKVEVYSSGGLAVKSFTGSHSNEKYSVSGLNPGLYFVRVQAKGINKVQKMVVD